MLKNKSKNNKFDKVVTMVILLSPMLNYYGFSIVSLPEIMLFLCLIYQMVKEMQNDRVTIVLNCDTGSLITYLFVAMMLTIVSQIFDAPWSPTILTTYIRFVFYVICIIFLAKDHFLMEWGSEAYLGISLINCVYMCVQELLYSISGVILQWNIPGLMIKIQEGAINGEYTGYDYRPSGFFSEPAQFSNFVIPCVLIVLLYEPKTYKLNKITRWAIAIFMSLSLLICGSGTGAMLLAIVMGMYFFNKIVVKGGKQTKKALGTFVVLLLVVVMIVPKIMQSKLSNGFYRVAQTRGVSTTGIRVLRGFIVFSKMSWLSKLIGIGYGNYEAYVATMNITTPYDTISSPYYVNGAAFILCGVGIIGALFFLRVLWKWFIHCKGIYRYRLILFAVTMLFSGSVISIGFILCCAFVLSGHKDKDVVVNGKYIATKSATGPGDYFARN